MVEYDERDNPSELFIETLRSRFRVDAEVDRVLTRKMHLRATDTSAYEPVSLEDLIAVTKTFIGQHIQQSFSLENARWLSGGASMIQMAFEVHSEQSNGGIRVQKMVLRMSPKEPVAETSFIRESTIVNTIHELQLLPVAQCFWVDNEAEYYPYPAIVYEMVAGVAKPSVSHSTQVTGIGLNYGPELRQKLAPQVIQHIARLHAFNAHKVFLKGFDPVEPGCNEAVLKEINWWQRVWEEDRGEEEPIIQVAANWLRRHAPPVDHVSIIHNDLRSGNFLFDEPTGEITAWLDWELVSLGDRHQDLGWFLSYQFGHYRENSNDFLASGLLPEKEFIDAYQRASGLIVDRERLRYYTIFNSWKAAIIVLATGYRVVRGEKTHQDVVVHWLSAIGYVILDNLRESILEVER